MLHHLHSERFCDKAPLEVYATLLDEGVYLCSVRTMHRILAENGELKERRNQLRHPPEVDRYAGIQHAGDWGCTRRAPDEPS